MTSSLDEVRDATAITNTASVETPASLPVEEQKTQETAQAVFAENAEKNEQATEPKELNREVAVLEIAPAAAEKEEAPVAVIEAPKEESAPAPTAAPVETPVAVVEAPKVEVEIVPVALPPVVIVETPVVPEPVKTAETVKVEAAKTQEVVAQQVHHKHHKHHNHKHKHKHHHKHK